MTKLFLELRDADKFTRAEILRFAEHKLDEATKIRGQIAKDLKRLGGDFGFEKPDVYSKLKDKYIRAHQSKKKLAILEQERRRWCKEVICHDRHQT